VLPYRCFGPLHAHVYLKWLVVLPVMLSCASLLLMLAMNEVHVYDLEQLKIPFEISE
jgi:hypothetical protein